MADSQQTLNGLSPIDSLAPGSTSPTGLQNFDSSNTSNAFPYAHANGTLENGSPDSKQKQPHVIDYTEAFPALNPGPGAGQAPHLHRTADNAWAKPPPLRSTVVSQVFQLPVDERRAYRESHQDRQFGDRTWEQTACNEIMQKTGTKIELCESKDHSLTIVVTGKRAEVEKARGLVVSELQHKAQREVRIPKDHHRVLIGKEGKKLQQLEKETTCRILIPGKDSPSDVIRIVGPRDGIEKAVHHILTVSDEQSKLAQEHLVIPKVYYPFIKGPNNETLDDLVARTSARINIPPPSVQSEIVVITGEKEGVYQAAKEIRAIYEDKKQNSQTVSVQIAKNQHRYIIGPGRSGLAEILRETGVSVEIPDEQTDSSTVTLRGDPGKLGQALSLVYAKASSVVSDHVECPAWLHKHVIGPKGANIRRIIGEEAKVSVDFDDENFIYIEGSPEEVKRAKAELVTLTQQLQKELTYEILHVLPNYHRHIIGQSGGHINEIRKETGASVNIPDEMTNSDEIRIEGPRTGVPKAKEMIMEVVKRLENEKSRDILIEQRFHRGLIGTKGEGAKELRERFPGVRISFPEQGRKSDVVTLRGPKDEVDKCHKHMSALAKQLQEENYQVKVPIFKDFLRNIIGKGGKNINKIRDETQTKIEIPPENTPQDYISVTGKKANVEKAKDLLQKIQNELASIVTLEIDIPHKLHSSLLGRGGKLIHSIQEECGGVQIHFPGQQAQSDKVTIRGPKEDAEKAKKHLAQLAKDKELSGFQAEIKVKPELHRFLIGRGGATIRKVREQNPNVRIIFPRPQDEDQETVLFVGRKDEVAKVQTQMEAIVLQLSQQKEIEVEVDPKFHAHFVGRGASVLREIQEQCGGCIISFPKRGTNLTKVQIKGAEECIQEAKRRIEEIVGDLVAQVTIEVIIPAKHHRALLGNRGAKVQDICQQCNVQIKFPDRRESTEEGTPEEPVGPVDSIKVTGRAENCEKAKERLESLVPITETLNVPFEFHGRLIGAQGAIVRQLMEQFDVGIAIPPREKELDEILVSGAKEQVDSAISEIMKKIEGLEEEKKDMELRSHKVHVEIPTKYLPQIIGPKGTIINKLRREHDVQVDIPKAGDQGNDNTIVTIIGYETNANALKTELEKIVADIQLLVSQQITLDCRIHPRIIGQKGRTIRKIMDDYDVEIKFPRSQDPDPNAVVVMGKDEEKVYECIDYLRNIEEEYLQDLTERSAYQHPDYTNTAPVPQKPKEEIVIRNAPWDPNDNNQFPAVGGMDSAVGQKAAALPAWGPPQRR